MKNLIFKIVTSIKSKKILFDIALSIVLVTIGIIFRFLPHPANFVPLGAIALFAGVYLSNRVAILLPLLIMVASDIFLGSYEWQLMLVVYGSLMLNVFLGIWLKKRPSWQIVLAGSLLGSSIFFLTTNFAVWLFTPWYSQSASGLSQCYLVALPFFKNSLLSDLFYTSLFFSAHGLIRVLARKRFWQKQTSF